MNTRKNYLCLMAGLLLAIVYAKAGHEDPRGFSRWLLAVLIGAGAAFLMMRDPNRVTRVVVHAMVGPLLLFLIAWEGVAGTPERFVAAAVWSAFLFGTLDSIWRLPANAKAGP